MSLIGLDLNATRLRAASGPAGSVPRALTFETGRAELPLVLSLERRQAEVGQAGLGLCRRLPHLACLNFLPHLGEPLANRKRWQAGRHRLDAESALTLVFQRLHTLAAGVLTVTPAVPAYLSRSQAAVLNKLAEQAKLPVLGSVSAPLAAALAAYLHDAWDGPALVGDLDGHAFTWSVVSADDRHLQVLGEQSFPKISLRLWKDRLLDAVADRCIHHSRRDPRDSAVAEQFLFEQLDRALDAARRGEVVELVVRAEQWFQNLLLRADDFDGFCTPLVRQAVDGMRVALSAAQTPSPPAVILLTDAAGRLPGLLSALHKHAGESAWVTVLPADAVSRAAHALGSALAAGKLARGHHDVAVPLTAVGGPRPVSRKPKKPARSESAAASGEDWSLSTEI